MTIWICLEKSFRSHISAPGCRSFWNPLVRSELANFSVQANSARLFSCKIHEEVWKHKFGESTTTFSAICLCTFRSVQRWVGFLFTFDLTLIIMDLLIYLIYLLFVQRVSFGPTNIRNRLSPPAFEVGRSCPKRPWQMHWQSRRNHRPVGLVGPWHLLNWTCHPWKATSGTPKGSPIPECGWQTCVVAKVCETRRETPYSDTL